METEMEGNLKRDDTLEMLLGYDDFIAGGQRQPGRNLNQISLTFHK